MPPSPYLQIAVTSMDRLGAMETFVRVVETKSFSAAARDLKVGQPAVSKSIAHLEEQFGVRLVMRSTRGLTMTEAGQHFYERARKIVDDAHDAALAVSGTGGGALRAPACQRRRDDLAPAYCATAACYSSISIPGFHSICC